jgi:dihydrofolate reductase / thymidylate synthase
MSLAHFSIIVSTDKANGIAKDGEIPWTSRETAKFFRDTTVGKGKNAVIMGRTTYEMIPGEHRPLEKRKNVVVSRTWKQENHPNISVYPSLVEALAGLGTSLKEIDEVFIIGGEQLYAEAVRDFLYLCRRVIVTRFKNDYDCDQFFPYDVVKNFPQAQNEVHTRDYNRYFYLPSVSHDEQKYLAMLDSIKERGDPKPGFGDSSISSIFGLCLEFDLTQRLPIITTKKINYEHIIHLLLFFISGKTNATTLTEKKVRFFEGVATKQKLQERNLDYDEGEFGPFTPYQWRNVGGDNDKKGIDQLSTTIHNIRHQPYFPHNMMCAWDVCRLSEMVLIPQCFACQFHVSSDKKWLDCQIYETSCDCFLDAPVNIAMYSLLTAMIAHITNLRPRKLSYIIGEGYLRSADGESINRQIRRTPRPFSRLSFRGATRLQEIDHFNFDSFIVEGYTSWAQLL